MYELIDIFTDPEGTEYKNDKYYILSGNHINEMINLLHKLQIQLDWYKEEEYGQLKDCICGPEHVSQCPVHK